MPHVGSPHCALFSTRHREPEVFEHLDDPSPMTADSSVRDAVDALITHRGRRRRLQATTAAALALVLVTGAAVALRSRPKPVNVATTPDVGVAPVPTSAPLATSGPTFACGPLEIDAKTSVARATATLGSIAVELSGTARDEPRTGTVSLARATVTVREGDRDLWSQPMGPAKDPGVLPWTFGPVSTTMTPVCLARFGSDPAPAL